MKEPTTLTELLRTLESSSDLRSLARECGLSVRELRRRLAVWRRELAEPEGGVAATGGKSAKAAAAGRSRRSAKSAAEKWPELPDARSLKKIPLPKEGSDVLEIHTDGASKGNPGPASIGAVFGQQDGPELCTLSEAIGDATNNVAEYRAVVAALEVCAAWKAERVHLYVDSELIARQLQGRYRVKSPDLRPLYQQVVHLSRNLRRFSVRHVPREQNAHADHLANQAFRKKKG
jgi:ribonuclease HI